VCQVAGFRTILVTPAEQN